MVCYRDEGPFATSVNDSIAKRHSLIQLSPSKKVDTIISEICRQFNYSPNEIEVTITTKTGIIPLNSFKNKTVQELGIQCSNAAYNTININPVKELPEDDLLLGASASPIAGDMPSSICEPEYPEMLMSDEDYGAHSSTSKAYLRPAPIETINYVGLVNQAMTCYLNSLLQALYMTPEFRNALYNWEFDGVKETRSIPYQLQKLFLNLQTSKRSAVETTDLTTSFGWHGSDAWQQHDIQELCRVMFDALEKKFADTKQANLINDLYEGKMLDYVKCLECGTEKSREDTFLDIPLPVRPFGSNVAYNSVEEALRGFVQPETLDGNNQYHCEKCNKKCDAHKGLKFIKFPYLLTLHLKRFDFDYNTMHRIKLNDKVVFSEKLNLNSFIQSKCETESAVEEREHTVKCDDCSTTDSGSALDDESCQGTDVSSTTNGQDDNCADSDEGIDVSSGNNINENDAKGPYVYELFSIMIHSGSASGGHYYAYIKDFDKNQWFCFNDQSVTRITEDDIRKTYGGGPVRTYYSGVYSSSTNAYMLMYRQIDKERNARAMKMEEFPPHIQKLLHQMQEKEEQDRIIREKEKDIIKLNVFCYHPIEGTLQDCKISMFIDSTLAEAANLAHQRFKLSDTVLLDECRIVSYNRKRNCIDCSFESDELKFCDIETELPTWNSDWMLEIKEPGTEFETFKQGGINLRVLPVSLETGDIGEPLYIRVNVDDTVRDMRMTLAKLLNRDLHSVKIALDMFSNGPKLLANDNANIYDEYDINCMEYKFFVSDGVDEENLGVSKFQKLLHRLGNILILQVICPETDLETLEMLSIPPLDMNQNIESTSSAEKGTNSPASRVSPQPGTCADGFGDQSNSEDSSLSDSDRTLVGEAPGECQAILSSNSNSPADQHMASPIDPAEDTYNYEVFGHTALDENWCSEQMIWDDGDSHQIDKEKLLVEAYRNSKTHKDYYFRIAKMTTHYTNDVTESHVKCCTVHLDGLMTLRHFKQHLEPVLKVPMAYFKVYRRYHNTDEEWSVLDDLMKLNKDEVQLVIKLGRVRRYDEFLCKVYYFQPEVNEHTKFLFERLIAKGQTVSQVKKEIINQAQKQNLIDNVPLNRCRLREKSWKRPRKVFLDEQKFDVDIIATSTSEIYLQILNEPEKVTSADQLVIFVRQWCPSTLTLKPFQEVVLDSTAMDEFKKKISEQSDIPPEFIEVAAVKNTFPCDIHVLGIQKDLEWNPPTTSIDQYPLTALDGNVFFYRDSREALKDLTPEERKEITLKENNRLGRYGTKTYSPGRETALKIYLDASPCKTDDNCID